MKKSYLTAVAVLMAFFAFPAKDALSQSRSSKPQWQYNYRKALQLAQKNDIPLWIHFYSDS